MKEHILKYLELNPNTLYYDLVKIFGLSLDNLLTLLGIVNYKCEDNYLHIYNGNGNRIYSEDSNGYWVKRKYDNNGNETYYEDSYGFWEKSYYENNILIKEENSDGYKHIF